MVSLNLLGNDIRPRINPQRSWDKTDYHGFLKYYIRDNPSNPLRVYRWSNFFAPINAKILVAQYFD